VLYDLGFLLMDLWGRGLRREANAVLNRYFARDVAAEEWAGLSLLPLFMSLRAGVRAMVGLDGLKAASRRIAARCARKCWPTPISPAR
jgi:aminoglycoside phosphotransferase family enzyme